jgi:hypothetical protein
MIEYLPAILGGLSSIFGSSSASDASDEALQQAANLRSQALSNLTGLSNYDLSNLNYNPEELSYIAESNPTLYSAAETLNANKVADSSEGRSAIVDALRNAQDLTESGIDAQTNAFLQKSKRDAESSARGREQAIINNMQERGMSGSGMEAMMREVAAQESADRQAESGLAETETIAKQKALANLQSGQLGESLRSGDVNLNTTNANILNDFAKYNSAAKQAVANANTDLINKTNAANTAAKRDVSKYNTTTSNEAQLENRQQTIANQMAQQQNKLKTAQLKNQAQLAGLQDIYAQGASDAANTRNIWNSIGSLPASLYSTYLNSNKKTPTV